ncbi:hypothetical protein AYO47_02975 [Planctomyces sp. SCGC AG-212-M04]|nr:hypothetical protein AYO47_02975 [Planctomyces sp. SCGC AG-212-M04]
MRAAPILDASVGELWGRLNTVHQQAIAARERPDEWSAFAARASNELKLIADDARRAHQRRIGPWRWVAGVDRREEAALREVQRLAESDVPALIASGPKGSALREKNVNAALGRLDDHLAGASPYLPPMRPIENQDGMDRTTGVRKEWPPWLVGMVIGDVVLVVAGVGWWWRRKRAGRRVGVY